MSILHFTPVSSDRAETKSGPTNSLSKCVSNFEASDSSLLFSAPLGHLLIISSHTHFITSYSVTKMSVCVCSVLDHQVQIYLQAQVQVPGQVPGLLQVCSRSGPRSAPGQVSSSSSSKTWNWAFHSIWNTTHQQIFLGSDFKSLL